MQVVTTDRTSDNQVMDQQEGGAEGYRREQGSELWGMGATGGQGSGQTATGGRQ